MIVVSNLTNQVLENLHLNIFYFDYGNLSIETLLSSRRKKFLIQEL